MCLSLLDVYSQAAYPQELGLQVLSKSQYTIRSLRIVVKRGQAPSKIELLCATETQNSSGRHDPVSRYFSASFTRCCDPVEWHAPCSSSTGVGEQRTIRVELRSCAFLKLLVYPPRPTTVTSDTQVRRLLSGRHSVGRTSLDIRRVLRMHGRWSASKKSSCSARSSPLRRRVADLRAQW